MSLLDAWDHPLMRLASTMSRLPRYLSLARALLADRVVAGPQKAILAAALAYTVSPIDLVPGFIPIAGQLDDLVVLLLGVRRALGACPPETARAHLADAGLSEDQLAADLVVVQRTAAWLFGKGAAAGLRAVSGSLRALAGAARRAGA
jgi:uncharacterized membrane protein YkvA (DUF1232 family)